jgi:hypothetical protein
MPSHETLVTCELSTSSGNGTIIEDAVKQTRQYTYTVTFRHFLCNHCSCGNAVVTYSECEFVALVIQHAMHMCHFVILDCQALQYFSTLPHKRPASCTMGARSFPGVKRPERGADHPRKGRDIPLSTL